jgi:ribosomal protein L11 methyltransferase
MAAEPRVVRYGLAVPAAQREEALARMLAAFPAGVEEEDGPDGTVLVSGYAAAESPRPVGLELRRTDVAPGWRDGWRAFHRPVEAAGVWIGPPWCDRPTGRDAVVIEPGLAFGTGAHGSTRAAAELLLREPPGGGLADLGCGSGVLSVLAARAGFAPVRACDLDPHAVTATRENAARNGVVVEAFRADVLCDPLPECQLAVANLQHDLLVPLFARDDLPARLIVSGLLVSEPFAPAGFVQTDRAVCDGWQALRLARPVGSAGAGPGPGRR